MSRPSAPCGLCGHRTWARGGVCTRCVHYARHKGYRPGDGLEGGRWVPVGGVMRWVEDELPGVLPLTLTTAQRREAHARYYLGERDEATVHGEREYQRARKRYQRRDAA